MESLYIIIIILFLILILSIIISHIKIDITNYEIKSKKIDKDIKIIFLSDLHNRNILAKLVNIVNNEKPDIIIFGGDMINDEDNKKNYFFDLYNSLKKYTIYYTFGNHEERMCEENKNVFINSVNKTKIILLNNNRKDLTNNIEILGLDSEIEKYLKFGKKGLDVNYIYEKLGKIDNKKYNLLIAHNPLEFDSYKKYKADLVLSGHIHGGLVRIPFIKGILSPDVSFFPKYDSGEYNSNGVKMIVSRGLGYSKRIPFRVFNPAEVVIINLKKEI